MTAAEQHDQTSSMNYALAPCSLGIAVVAAVRGRLAAFWFGDSPEAVRARFLARHPRAQEAAGDPLTAALLTKAVEIIERPHLPWREPLALVGTPFQLQVWAALREIPPGETASYAQIARRIGRASATRAVAAACAANPIAIVVPCHRVIRSDGALSGYAGGVWRKRVLLEREAAARLDAAA